MSGLIQYSAIRYMELRYPMFPHDAKLGSDALRRRHSWLAMPKNWPPRLSELNLRMVRSEVEFLWGYRKMFPEFRFSQF